MALIETLSDELYGKLADWGLVPPRREEPKLRDLLDAYTQDLRSRAKTSTTLSQKPVIDSLLRFFGPGRPLSRTDPLAANAWRVGMVSDGYAKATIARRVKVARTIGNRGRRLGLARDNPFADVDAGPLDNPERTVFVTNGDVPGVTRAVPARCRVRAVGGASPAEERGQPANAGAQDYRPRRLRALAQAVAEPARFRRDRHRGQVADARGDGITRAHRAGDRAALPQGDRRGLSSSQQRDDLHDATCAARRAGRARKRQQRSGSPRRRRLNIAQRNHGVSATYREVPTAGMAPVGLENVEFSGDFRQLLAEAAQNPARLLPLLQAWAELPAELRAMLLGLSSRDRR
ncbi:MAG: hypothetical protein ACK4PI_07360 [Tepidisphaerales bacterium]